jgi:hypothetical protein
MNLRNGAIKVFSPVIGVSRPENIMDADRTGRIIPRRTVPHML